MGHLVKPGRRPAGRGQAGAGLGTSESHRRQMGSPVVDIAPRLTRQWIVAMQAAKSRRSDAVELFDCKAHTLLALEDADRDLCSGLRHDDN